MPVVAKSPPEEKLLRTLWNRGPLTRGAARADADTVRQLMATNLIEEVPPATKRGSPKLALTAAGRVAAAKLPPPKPTQLDVFRQVAALREELDELRRFVAQRFGGGIEDPTDAAPGRATQPEARALEPARKADEPSLADFGRRFRQAVAELDRVEGHGGLVPLPRVRDALRDAGLSRSAFDDAVLALEEQYEIDLKVANDPSRLPDGGGGIDGGPRGLLYFVVTR